MKKVVKIKESQLNDIIKKVIKEQEGAQVMSTGPSAEQIAGSPESETSSPSEEGPNFDEFLSCAKKLMDQGVTVGNLVDQLLDAEESGEESEEGEPEPTPDTEGGTEPQNPMGE